MALTLTDLGNKQLLQRTIGENSAIVTIEGTYTGLPSYVEARIVDDGTSDEVVTWTVIDSSPSGNAFSGQITVPCGGKYNIQVRDDVGGSDNGTNGWWVGDIILCIGQSNVAYMFDESSSPPVLNADIITFDDNGDQNYIWKEPTGNGIISLLNSLNDITGIPVAAANASAGGSCLTKEAGDLDGSTNWYWWNESTGQPGPLYVTMQSRVTSFGGEFAFVFWNQGEQDGKFPAVTATEYKNAFVALWTQFWSDYGDKPIFISPIGRNTSGTGSDASFEKTRTANYEMVRDYELCYLAETRYDYVLTDSWHFTPASYEANAPRISQSIAHYLEEVSYSGAGPKILGYTKIDSQNFYIHLLHDGGSDFTPTSGITGFIILDSGTPETISAAVRYNANTIKLTISGTITGIPTIRYMYGANPTITGIVKDNTALTLPVEGMESIPEMQSPQILPNLNSFFSVLF
jgi:hypothetical protein